MDAGFLHLIPHPGMGLASGFTIAGGADDVHVGYCAELRAEDAVVGRVLVGGARTIGVVQLDPGVVVFQQLHFRRLPGAHFLGHVPPNRQDNVVAIIRRLRGRWERDGQRNTSRLRELSRGGPIATKRKDKSVPAVGFS